MRQCFDAEETGIARSRQRRLEAEWERRKREGGFECKLTIDEPMKTLGEYTRELREKKDYSVRELAKKIGVSAPFLSDVELGRRHPSHEVLSRLASELGTTAKELEKYDTRPPMQELKRMAATDPAMGFALRKVVDDGVSAKDLLAFLNQHGKKKR
jgi:transcriptional regulator with XRE-family HTH domain